MGVRLVRYTNGTPGYGNMSGDHNELINRDMMNQHPIYAIIGLQEVLNILEDTIEATNEALLQKDKILTEKINIINQNIEDIQQSIETINETIANLKVINEVIDTYTVDLTYDETAKSLKADVKIFEDKDDTNAIQSLAEGLYVPKTVTEDTETITWSEISLGETLLDIYNNGIRFSHNNNSWSNLYSASEANAWYWDNNLQSFVQPQNTSYFTGFVTENFYDYYTHRVKLRSTDSDNDVNGVVIGFVFDENGNPHTLTALCERVGWTGVNNWALVYDFYLPDQQIIYAKGNGPNGTVPGNAGSSGWSGLGNGITVEVTKFKNIITATASNWNGTELNENTKITINLDDYEWGYLFRDSVRYGYCNISQAKSYFTDITFLSDNSAASSKLLAYVKLSEEDDNALEIKDDGLYAPPIKISAEANNRLVKKDDGYYVKDVLLSEKEDNALELLSDGYYVREHSNVKVVTVTNHGFVTGDFIYFHPSKGYQLASAIDDYDSNIVGMVTEVIDANNFEYMWAGFYKTDVFNTANGFVQGMPLYISDVNPGKVVQEQPDISKAVGYPVEDIGLIISIERGIQYNREASIGDFKSSANTYNVRSDGFIRVVEGVEYKLSLVTKLLEILTEEFKANYIVIDEVSQTIQFINTETLYLIESVPDGMNLFIKAF